MTTTTDRFESEGGTSGGSSSSHTSQIYLGLALLGRAHPWKQKMKTILLCFAFCNRISLSAFEAVHVEKKEELISVEPLQLAKDVESKDECAGMDGLMRSIVDHAEALPSSGKRKKGSELTLRYVALLEAQNKCVYHWKNAGVLSALGQAYATLGNISKARDALSAANALDALSWASVFSQWLTSIGQYDEAWAVLQKVSSERNRMTLEQDLRYIVVYTELCFYQPKGINVNPESLIQDLLSTLNKKDQTTGQEILSELTVTLRIRAHFLLGKLFERIENFDESLDHFILGNEIQLARLSPISLYSSDVKALLCLRDALHSGMPLEAIPSPIPQLITAKPQPIFIIGAPRSGSTLIERILGAHSKVAVLGETSFVSEDLVTPLLKNIISINETMSSKECRHKIDESLTQIGSWDYSVDALVSAYLRSIENAVDTQGIRYVVDKQLFNFLSVALLSRLFPNAFFLIVTRDRLDVAASIYFTDLTDLPFSYDPEFIHRFFHLYDETMATWQKLNIKNVYEIKYERLVENPDELRSLFATLNLDFESAVLDFYKQDFSTRLKTASMHDVRKPIYPSRVNFSRPYLATQRGLLLLEKFTPGSSQIVINA